MKSGPEAHFLSGQIFMLGIAAVAVLPRMPSDTAQGCTIGGRLSFPFRRALLLLIGISVVRLLCFHVLVQVDDNDANDGRGGGGFLAAMDATLETVHVIGQTFLCLTTAYLLQRQLSNYINIEGGAPGRNLVPFLIAVSCLTIVGSIGANTWHAGWGCLINLAEAISCWPVLKTLRLYISVTTQGSIQKGLLRGPVLVQMLTVAELWYLSTSLTSFLAEAADKTHGEMPTDTHGHFLRLLSIAVRQNQDNGVDDWTRLLLHAVFLNGLDELHHVVVGDDASPHRATSSNANGPGASDIPDNVSEDMAVGGESVQYQPLIHRRWLGHP